MALGFFFVIFIWIGPIFGKCFKNGQFSNFQIA